MKKFLSIYGGVLSTLVLFLIMLLPVVVGAQGSNAGFGQGPNAGAGNGPNAGYGGNSNAGSATLDNPLGVNSFCGLVIKLVQAVMVIGIPIAVLFIVWAGLKFVLAQGKPDALAKARSNFLYVVIGIGIFVGASLIANVIVNTLQDLGVRGINSCT